MKSYILSLLSFLILLTAPLSIARAEQETFSSGSDWRTRMSDREKIIAIIAPTIVLQNYGIPIRQDPDSYVERIDQVLEKNPELEKEDVTNLFTSTVYYYEPWTRKPLEELELALLRGETNIKISPIPRLTINELSREALDEMPQE
jgi:hypothetical protein